MSMKIQVIDGHTIPNPEDVAMLQALLSRSAEPVENHLAKLGKMGSQRFMDNYVVGYNHKSIADCGTTTIFLEGVSLLAAKAIQDWPLYCGQETSTRIIDFSTQPIIDPVGSTASKAILDRWLDFYLQSRVPVMDHVRSKYPMGPKDKADSYDRAVKARAFDILRGFLPAGVTTQLSWHTNLRQASDHLSGLVHHPASEIQQIAVSLTKLLHENYGSSGFGSHLAQVSGVTDGMSERQAWEAKVAGYALEEDWFSSATGWSDVTSLYENVRGTDKFSCLITNVNSTRLRLYEGILKTRPRGCVLPHFLLNLGHIQSNFLLDFGSFRDIQRHRNGVCTMPILTTGYEFASWYLDQLPPELASKARALIDSQAIAIESVTDNPVDRQYYTALGYRVPCSVTYGLPAMIYVLELRSGKTIHPTLRSVILAMVKKFRMLFPNVPIHVDEDPDDWSVRRGDQTITEKVKTP